MSILSGYSLAGASIAGRVTAEAFTEGAQSVAASEIMLSRGASYAASRAAYGIPGNVTEALPSILVRSQSI